MGESLRRPRPTNGCLKTRQTIIKIIIVCTSSVVHITVRHVCRTHVDNPFCVREIVFRRFVCRPSERSDVLYLVCKRPCVPVGGQFAVADRLDPADGGERLANEQTVCGLRRE